MLVRPWDARALGANLLVTPLTSLPQVVSDYLTPFDGEAAYLAAGSSPVAVYTYKMTFSRRSGACSGGACTGLGVS